MVNSFLKTSLLVFFLASGPSLWANGEIVNFEKRVNVGSAGEIVLKVNDVGEPAAQPIWIEAHLQCKNGSKKQLFVGRTCEYKSFHYDAVKQQFTLTLLKADLSSGYTVCKIIDRKVFDLTESCAR